MQSSEEMAIAIARYHSLQIGLPVNFYYTIGRGGCLAGLAIPQAWAMLELGIADYVVLTGAVDDSSRAKAARSSAW